MNAAAVEGSSICTQLATEIDTTRRKYWNMVKLDFTSVLSECIIETQESVEAILIEEIDDTAMTTAPATGAVQPPNPSPL